LEGSGRGLIEILSLHSPGGSQENDGKPARISGVLTEIQTKYLPNASLERYHYANWLGKCWKITASEKDALLNVLLNVLTPENGGDMFLENICRFSTDYMAL
jgi:hypothetical protein